MLGQPNSSSRKGHKEVSNRRRCEPSPAWWEFLAARVIGRQCVEGRQRPRAGNRKPPGEPQVQTTRRCHGVAVARVLLNWRVVAARQVRGPADAGDPWRSTLTNAESGRAACDHGGLKWAVEEN